MRIPILVVFLSTVAAAEPSSLLLKQANAAYSQREDLAQAKKALGLYEEAIGQGASDPEPYWKASRTAWWIGENSSDSKDKITYFQRGIDRARDAIKIDPNSVEGHFWLGGNLGSYGDARGVMKSLSLVKPIRQEMQEVLRLNERYDGGAAYHVLGVVDYKVPGIAGGNKKRARAELDKALAIEPNDPFLRYYRAEFFKVTGDKSMAQNELAALATLKVSAEKEPELHLMQRRGQKFLN